MFDYEIQHEIEKLEFKKKNVNLIFKKSLR